MNFASQQLGWAPLIEPNGIRGFERPLEQIADPRLRVLFDHWETARAGRPWILRSDLRPEAFAGALPHIAVIERRRRQEPTFYIRLAGEEVVNPVFGFAAGRFVETITPAWYRDHLAASYRHRFHRGEPCLELVRVVHGYRVVLYHRLTLPVTRSGLAVDQLLVASVRTRRLEDFMTASKEMLR